MARTDSTVIQGALITCIILLVLSLAGNFFFWNWGDTASSEAETAQQQLNTARGEIRTQASKIDRLKSMIGFGQLTEAEIEALKNSVSDDPEMAEIEQAFIQDMSLLPPDVEPQNLNYRFLPLSLMQALRDRNTELADAQRRINELSTEKDAVIDSETAAREAAEAARTDLAGKLSTAQDTYQQDRQRMIQEKEEINDLLLQKNQQMQQFVSRSEADKQKLQAEKQQLQQTVSQQAEMIDQMQEDEFETAQGVVTLVAPGGRVYINLGRLDLLRTGIVFGVLDAEEIRVSSATPKAKIEVIQVSGDHSAVARVISQQDIGDPIVEGDKIYSPFWEPGQQVKVALAGSFDIDNDGRDDREMVKNMIRRAGAEIVAEVDEQGMTRGEVTFDTRYLVLGQQRDYQATDDVERSQRESQFQQAMGQMKARAQQLGVTEISVNKLLGYLRSIDDEKTIPLGSQASGADFPPDPTGTSSNRLPSDVAEIYRNQGAGSE